MIDWLIIGGGPQGIHMANRLLGEGGHPNMITVLDPNAEPLARWKHHTENTGMTHLRSPEYHNIGIDPYSLGRHVATYEFVTAVLEQKNENGSALKSEFIPPYSRPSLRSFMHHAETIVEETGLMRRWKSARAISIKNIRKGYRIQTEANEQIEARNVVLALGTGDQPNWPKWATQLRAQNRQAKVHHIFSTDFKRHQIDEEHDVAIVGAGISAAQLALSLLEVNPNRQITLLSRHFLRKEDFDSDQGWLGPTLLTGFHREKDYSKRRAMIQEARNRGSLAAEVTQTLEKAILRDKTINLEMAEIDSASCESVGTKLELQIRPFELDETQYQKMGALTFNFNTKAQRLQVDTVVLATGFEAKRPGGTLIDRAIRTMDLPTATDGFPIVDRHLRWREGLFVMGPLAELEVGPVSRNISGARMAADRIIKSPELEKTMNGSNQRKRSPIARKSRRLAMDGLGRSV
jgi:thioredoxin reductase